MLETHYDPSLSPPGLIRLPRAAEINVGVRLVCLPLSAAGLSFEAPGNVGTVVGWGFTSAVDQRLESHKISFRQSGALSLVQIRADTVSDMLATRSMP